MFHAAVLLWVAGISHLLHGDVDTHAMAWLLVGSIPGVLIGSQPLDPGSRARAAGRVRRRPRPLGDQARRTRPEANYDRRGRSRRRRHRARLVARPRVQDPPAPLARASPPRKRRRIDRAVARVLSTAFCVALLAATAAAFALTEGAKTELSPIYRTNIDKVFSPSCNPRLCRGTPPASTSGSASAEHIQVWMERDGKRVATIVPGKTFPQGRCASSSPGSPPTALDAPGRHLPAGRPPHRTSTGRSRSRTRSSSTRPRPRSCGSRTASTRTSLPTATAATTRSASATRSNGPAHGDPLRRTPPGRVHARPEAARHAHLERQASTAVLQPRGATCSRSRPQDPAGNRSKPFPFAVVTIRYVALGRTGSTSRRATRFARVRAHRRAGRDLALRPRPRRHRGRTRSACARRGSPASTASTSRPPGTRRRRPWSSGDRRPGARSAAPSARSGSRCSSSRRCGRGGSAGLAAWAVGCGAARALARAVGPPPRLRRRGRRRRRRRGAARLALRPRAVAARGRRARLRAGADPGLGRLDEGEPAAAAVRRRRRRGARARLELFAPSGREAPGGRSSPRGRHAGEEPALVVRPTARARARPVRLAGGAARRLVRDLPALVAEPDGTKQGAIYLLFYVLPLGLIAVALARRPGGSTG